MSSERWPFTSSRRSFAPRDGFVARRGAPLDALADRRQRHVRADATQPSSRFGTPDLGTPVEGGPMEPGGGGPTYRTAWRQT